MSKLCEICGKPLNESQYRLSKTYKSCPNCSIMNGKEHVYYNYPDAFGTTMKRSSSSSPEGAQSHCTVCRGNGSSYPNKMLCSELAE